MKYFENRQNVTLASPERMEEVFKCIADHFYHKRVKSPRSHPPQKLWNRKDPTATNELHFVESAFNECLPLIQNG